MTDTLVAGGTVVTVDDENAIHEDGAVLVADDEIQDVGPTSDLESRYDADETIDASGKVVIPGLINLHVHSGFIRGLAEDLPVWEWLAEHVDPTHRALRRADARAAYELCYAEMAKAGITCALDMYRYMDEAAEVVDEYGLRAVLSPYVADREGYEFFPSVEDNVELLERYHDTADGRVKVWFGLEHIEYCTEEAYRRVADLAAEYDVGIHTHGEESAKKAQELTDRYGMRPIEVFDEWGILGPKTVVAHCVWLTNREVEVLSETGTSVAHCPTSNEKLASGVAPVPKLLNHAVSVGLGTDGIKENNRLDVIQEMKNAALLQKVHRLDARAIPGEQALRMATMGGAEALGLADEVGSIEVGKQADLVVLNFQQPHLRPNFGAENVVPNLVHAAMPSDVETVLVAGDRVVDDGEFLPRDQDAIIENYEETARALVERRDNEEWA
ncbi:amidohydrolase family protein [Halorientalis sp.]|uniref:amidohydrolase family protein n=1 Tax=Halorientalis sp. TaxID=1931229 RepID=UPI002603F641|nr:amidohydrolase [Halorientalis sp.]